MRKSFIEFLFSSKNEGVYKVIRLFGIKIKIKLNRLIEREERKLEDIRARKKFFPLLNEVLKSDNSYFPLVLDDIDKKGCMASYDIYHSNYHYVDYLFNNISMRPFDAKKTFNYVFMYGLWYRPINELEYAKKHQLPVFIVEDGFIRSIDTFVNLKADMKYRAGLSFTIDDHAAYFDASRASRLELMLNDKNLIITQEQKKRARKCIDRIVETHLTKYNHQPIVVPNIGRKGAKKILVIDQSYGDMSIFKGLADDDTFKDMLKAAIDENPNADIIIKTHPDTMVGAGGYYKDIIARGNVYTMKDAINPISIIKYVDKVYVCTSQFGFEALMCGKEVVVFGMPFYAGWGLTDDRQILKRRTNKRMLEEVFYIAYIMYSLYVNPEKKCRCEIEDAMDYILKLRQEWRNELSDNKVK